MAEAIGIKGIRIEDPKDVDPGVAEALSHPGPVVVDAVVAREELAMPPAVTVEMAKGFTLYMLKAILSGRGDEIVELARRTCADRRERRRSGREQPLCRLTHVTRNRLFSLRRSRGGHWNLQRHRYVLRRIELQDALDIDTASPGGRRSTRPACSSSSFV